MYRERRERRVQGLVDATRTLLRDPSDTKAQQQLVKGVGGAMTMRQGLELLEFLMMNPYSDDTNRQLDIVVARYNGMAIDFLDRADALLHPGGWAWLLLLQVRFVNAVCLDRPAVKAAIEKALQNPVRPTIELLMREVLRQTMVELIEWGKLNKQGLAKGSFPKGADLYWHEAFEEMNVQAEREAKNGRTIQNAPREWYLILGVDYSRNSSCD